MARDWREYLRQQEIKTVPIEDVKPYPNNPRDNSPAVPAVAASIERFGFRNPILVDGDGVIIEGHTRRLAAIKLGMKEVPVVYATDLTPDEVKALRVIDNKTAELADWDEDALAGEAELLKDAGFDLEDFGFDPKELEALLSTDPAEGQTDADDVPDVDESEPVRSKRGEVYVLGEHRLMCGDSTSSEDWKTLMGGERGGMVFTDPPYGVAIGDKNKALNEKQKSANRILENIEGDTLDEGGIRRLLTESLLRLRDNVSDDACWFITFPLSGWMGAAIISSMSEAGIPFRHVLVWVKNQQTFSLGRLDYDYKHEPILYTWIKSHRNFKGGEFRHTVWEYDKPTKCNLHPTMKPVELVENAILDGTERGMTVVDAFGGSGTTMIAAEKTGRRARLMELDPHYCDVIRRRWAEYVHGVGCDWEALTPVASGGGAAEGGAS